VSRDPFSSDPRDDRGSQDSPTDTRSGTTRLGTSRNPKPTLPEIFRESERPQSLDVPQEIEGHDSGRTHYLGDRSYFLRESELRTLSELGTFRAISARDLARISYGGDARKMEREIRRLKENSLLSEKKIEGERGRTIRLFALTKKGARLVRTSGAVPDEQAIYHGFVKPREAKHDADLYALYHAEIERIKQAGGRPIRVLLDFELKRRVNRDLAAASSREITPGVRAEIAERHGLAVVGGRIALPDLRIEYDSAEMERKHVDLELATRSYRPRMLAAKAKAGFSLYARREDASRLRRVLDQREITAEILSL